MTIIIIRCWKKLPFPSPLSAPARGTRVQPCRAQLLSKSGDVARPRPIAARLGAGPAPGPGRLQCSERSCHGAAGGARPRPRPRPRPHRRAAAGGRLPGAPRPRSGARLRLAPALAAPPPPSAPRRGQCQVRAQGAGAAQEGAAPALPGAAAAAGSWRRRALPPHHPQPPAPGPAAHPEAGGAGAAGPEAEGPAAARAAESAAAPGAAGARSWRRAHEGQQPGLVRAVLGALRLRPRGCGDRRGNDRVRQQRGGYAGPLQCRQGAQLLQHPSPVAMTAPSQAATA